MSSLKAECIKALCQHGMMTVIDLEAQLGAGSKALRAALKEAQTAGLVVFGRDEVTAQGAYAVTAAGRKLAAQQAVMPPKRETAKVASASKAAKPASDKVNPTLSGSVEPNEAVAVDEVAAESVSVPVKMEAAAHAQAAAAADNTEPAGLGDVVFALSAALERNEVLNARAAQHIELIQDAGMSIATLQGQVDRLEVSLQEANSQLSLARDSAQVVDPELHGLRSANEKLEAKLLECEKNIVNLNKQIATANDAAMRAAVPVAAQATVQVGYFVVPDFDGDMRYADLTEARMVAESFAREDGCKSVHVMALVDTCTVSVQWNSLKSEGVSEHE